MSLLFLAYDSTLALLLAAKSSGYHILTWDLIELYAVPSVVVSKVPLIGFVAERYCVFVYLQVGGSPDMVTN
jgi:hypothetical protein